MYKIVNGKGTGKTKALLVKAHDDGAIVFCKDAESMIERARGYGLLNMDIRNYPTLLELNELWNSDSKVYIHNIDDFLKFYFGNLVKGYTMTYEP